jgi:hypothetical protein
MILAGNFVSFFLPKKTARLCGGGLFLYGTAGAA